MIKGAREIHFGFFPLKRSEVKSFDIISVTKNLCKICAPIS